MERRVLVIDGSEAIRQHLRFVLASRGYEMDEAVDCRSALAKLSGSGCGGYELVILDEDMPMEEHECFFREFGGAEEPNYPYPLLLLSREERTGRAAGAGTARLSKPFSTLAFFSVLRHMGLRPPAQE